MHSEKNYYHKLQKTTQSNHKFIKIFFFDVFYSLFFYWSNMYLSVFLSISIIIIPSSLSPSSVNETMCELEGYNVKMCVRKHTKYVILLFIMIIFYALIKSKWNYLKCFRWILLKKNFENKIEWRSKYCNNWK